MPVSTPAPARAFTLIEALIVIAVIGLLVAILAPSLGGARESGRSAVCLSAVRQLALALDAYANDAADRYCPGAADFAANLHRWHGARPSASAAFSPAGGALTPYLTSGDAGAAARTCPVFAPTAAALAGANVGFERSAGGYGYNNAFAGVDRAPAGRTPAGRTLWTVADDRAGSARARFADPARTVAFADAALADGNRAAGSGGLIEYSFIEPRFWPDAVSAARPDPTVHFRHHRRRARGEDAAGRAAAAWLDGHASLQKQTFTAPSAVYPAVPGDSGIGWFGGTDDNSLFDYE